MAKRCAASIVFLLGIASAFAISPALATGSSDWVEFRVSAAWSPARGALFGWQTTFMVAPQWGVSIDCLLDLGADSGGYATANAVYYLSPPSPDSDIALPLAAGIGIARQGSDLSFAMDASAAVEWYPLSVDSPSSDRWILGLGTGLEASLYFVKWGVQPALSAAVMLPFNYSAIEESPY
jgi:hypothetical protein